MTPDQLREAAAVIMAAADGKQVQMKLGGVWKDIEDPDFDCQLDRYRIKPEPVKMRVQMMKHKDDKRYLVCAMECDFSRYELGGWKPVSDIVEIEIRDAD